MGVLPFPRGDIHLEGEEFDAALMPGEKAYDDESEADSDFEDDCDEVLAPISDAAAATPAATQEIAVDLLALLEDGS